MDEAKDDRDERDELAALVRSTERLARRTQALGRHAGWRSARPTTASTSNSAGEPVRSKAAGSEGSADAKRSATTTSISGSVRDPGAAAGSDARRRPSPALAPSTPERSPAAAPTLSSDSRSEPGAIDSSAAAGTRAVARAARTLDELAAAVANCRACELCATRTQTVFADGSPSAKLMFVGEGPGAEEDRTGVPFVGDAGQLLSKIIADGMKLDRARDVYIANVVKCRPPGNRDPSPEEKAACTPFLERQIELVDPTVIVPLGRHAAGHLLRSEASMSRLRGQVVRENGRAIVPTFHPAYLLRTPAKKKECWEDIQLAMRELGLPRPR